MSDQLWHWTVGHDSQAFAPGDYWTAAIEQLEVDGAELIREWNSHASTGDRISREYEFPQSIIRLELDRWNGFTISGDRRQTISITERITARLEESLT